MNKNQEKTGTWVGNMLARQMRRAARSTPCNIAEALSGSGSDPVLAVRLARVAQREVQCFMRMSKDLLSRRVTGPTLPNGPGKS